MKRVLDVSVATIENHCQCHLLLFELGNMGAFMRFFIYVSPILAVWEGISACYTRRISETLLTEYLLSVYLLQFSHSNKEYNCSIYWKQNRYTLNIDLFDLIYLRASGECMKRYEIRRLGIL